MHFSKGVCPRLLCKNGDFFHLLFLCKVDQDREFCKVLERKEAFLDYKNISSKHPRNLHFCRGVGLWFLPKNVDFSIVCFFPKWIKKCFVKVLKEKKPFKNIKTSVQKNLHFSKWVSPCFFSKSGDFSIVCFYAKWIKKKCFLKFWEKKKLF